jgi:hypothetical protein
MEHPLLIWIAAKWKPKAHFDIQLGSKGFFTIIFTQLDDRDIILEGGPYFFNSAGLYLWNWTKCFNPNKEDFTWTPVWIRLYSLPQDYWDDETLKYIGNALGNFVKIEEQTKTNKYTSYARICIYMHISKDPPDSICLVHEDTEWIQTLDYEHVPFRCHKCHEHGHLFRDFPQNKPVVDLKGETHTDEEGFWTIPN